MNFPAILNQPAFRAKWRNQKVGNRQPKFGQPPSTRTPVCDLHSRKNPPHGAALADRAATRPERRAWADGSTITRIMTATRTPPGLRAACSPRPPGRQRGPVCEQRKQYEDLRRMEQPGHSTIAVFRPTPSSAAISLLPRMRRVTTQAAFAESLMAAEGQSTEALCAVCDALRLIFASHSLAFCSAAKRAASTGIPSIRIIVESSCKQTREKCLGRLSLARPARQTTISVGRVVSVRHSFR